MKIYLKIPNVLGEVTDAQFPGAVELDSARWGHGRLTDPATGLPLGKILPHLFRVVKFLDRASPSIALLLLARTPVRLELFHVFLPGGPVLTRAVFDGAVFEVLDSSGSRTSGRMVEQIAASYARVTVFYSKLLANGSAQPVGSYQYDAVT